MKKSIKGLPRQPQVVWVAQYRLYYLYIHNTRIYSKIRNNTTPPPPSSSSHLRTLRKYKEAPGVKDFFHKKQVPSSPPWLSSSFIYFIIIITLFTF